MTASGRIEEIRVVDCGFLAVTGSGSKVGLWVPGAVGWSWWPSAPRDPTNSSLCTATRWRPDGCFAVCRLAPDAPTYLRSFRLYEAGRLLGIQRRSTGPLRVFCENGVLTVPLLRGAPAFERRISIGSSQVHLLDGLAVLGEYSGTDDMHTTRVQDDRRRGARPHRRRSSRGAIPSR